MDNEILEKFADAQHEIWSHWMKYLFTKGWDQPDGTFKISRREVERWRRQMETPYSELSDSEQISDKDVVKEHMQDCIIALVEKSVSASLDNLEEEFVLIEKDSWEEIQETLEVISNTELEGAINDIKGA
jgi:hypothetical protein